MMDIKHHLLISRKELMKRTGLSKVKILEFEKKGYLMKIPDLQESHYTHIEINRFINQLQLNAEEFYRTRFEDIRSDSDGSEE